jgi:hypothetical protein
MMKSEAQRIRALAVAAFVVCNIAVVVGLELLPKSVVMPVFLLLFVVGTLPKFAGAMTAATPARPKPTAATATATAAVAVVGSTPSPPRINEPAVKHRWSMCDPGSKVRVVAVIPVFRENKEELLEGIESFWLSRLPFPRDELHIVFVVDGVHTRGGGDSLDAAQTETVFALTSVLFPEHQFVQSALDGSVSFSDETPPPHPLAQEVVYREFDGKREPVWLLRGTTECYPFTLAIKHTNHGKRDSQMLCFELMSRSTGTIPKARDAILIMDSDSAFEWRSEKVTPGDDSDELESGEPRNDSLAQLYSTLMADPQIGGVTGEVEVSNMEANVVTLFQWFEYKISHCYAKLGESSFGIT